MLTCSRLSSHLIGFQEVLRENGMRNLLGKLNDPDEQCRQEVRVSAVAHTLSACDRSIEWSDTKPRMRTNPIPIDYQLR